MDSERHTNQDDKTCHFEPKTPMFFNIILQTTVKQRRLEIPSGFVREFGNCLGNPIMLKVPNGNTWEVELSNVGEEVWLGKGWVEFSEHHSLKHGHLLVFKYQKKSHFNVHIFDMSAVEIQYPCKGSKSQPNINKDKGIATLLSDDPMFKLKPKSDWQIQQFGGNLESSSEVHSSAANLTPSNPWFKVVLKSVHMKRKYMVVPFRFMEKHMEMEAKTVLLKVEDKSWAVKLNVYPSCRIAGLFRGVLPFMRENSLKKGDVCIFELISNNILNVSIFG